MKILAVDDSVTARLIVTSTLQGEGHTVLEAPDGQVALSVLESQLESGRIEVVFMDWNMPVMSGIEALVAIRKNPALKKTKVVMCTTEAEKGSIMKAIQAGANGYLLQPVTPEAILRQLAKVAQPAA